MPSIGPHEHDLPSFYFHINRGISGRPKDVAHSRSSQLGNVSHGGLS